MEAGTWSVGYMVCAEAQPEKGNKNMKNHFLAMGKDFGLKVVNVYNPNVKKVPLVAGKGLFVVRSNQ